MVKTRPNAMVWTDWDTIGQRNVAPRGLHMDMRDLDGLVMQAVYSNAVMQQRICRGLCAAGSCAWTLISVDLERILEQTLAT